MTHYGREFGRLNKMTHLASRGSCGGLDKMTHLASTGSCGGLDKMTQEVVVG